MVITCQLALVLPMGAPTTSISPLHPAKYTRKRSFSCSRSHQKAHIMSRCVTLAASPCINVQSESVTFKRGENQSLKRRVVTRRRIVNEYPAYVLIRKCHNSGYASGYDECKVHSEDCLKYKMEQMVHKWCTWQNQQTPKYKWP